jgi:uncharacterized protein (UPF0332 family)
LPDEEIDHLLSQAELRLDAAHSLLKDGFYDDAVSRAITACTLPLLHYFLLGIFE